jgi:hypothetical protein
LAAEKTRGKTKSTYENLRVNYAIKKKSKIRLSFGENSVYRALTESRSEIKSNQDWQNNNESNKIIEPVREILNEETERKEKVWGKREECIQGVSAEMVLKRLVCQTFL